MSAPAADRTLSRPLSPPSATATGDRCRSCDQAAVRIFFTVDDVPVHNSLLLPTRDEAIDYPRGRLRLGHCPSCGFVQNTAFESDRMHYGPGYEDSQASSPRFVAFATDLARSLIAEHAVRHGTVVEVGSGKGDFLDLLVRLGENRGVGYDPATDPADVPASVEHRQEAFTAATSIDALDLLVCRHTLEHVPDVSAFVSMLGGQLARHPGAVGYVEVPDLLRVLREGAFWDLYYEHCSYFTASTLTDLLRRHELHVLGSRLGFDDQYVLVEAATTGPSGEAASTAEAMPTSSTSAARAADEVATAVELFTAQLHEVRARWQEAFVDWSTSGRRVVLWGGSSKAVAFLATLDLDDQVEAVIDINPKKHGRFLPGSGHEVLAPSALEARPVDVVVVMNPVYVPEIRADLDSRGLQPEVHAA